MASTARIDELKKKFDENPRRYFAPLANEFRKAGEIDQAIMICEEFLPQQPGHMSGHIVYGQALFEAGKLPESRGVFETALGLDPENLIALRHLGDIARDQGDRDAARTWYGRVLEADPRNEEIQAVIASLDAMPQAHVAAPEAPVDEDKTAVFAPPPIPQPPAPAAPTPELLDFDDFAPPAPPPLPAPVESAAPEHDPAFADTLPVGMPVIPSAPIYTPSSANTAIIEGFSAHSFQKEPETESLMPSAEGLESTAFQPPEDSIPTSDELDSSLESGVPSFSAPAGPVATLEGLQGSGGDAHDDVDALPPLDVDDGMVLPPQGDALAPAAMMAHVPSMAEELPEFDVPSMMTPTVPMGAVTPTIAMDAIVPAAESNEAVAEAEIPMELPPAVIAAEGELIAAGETPAPEQASDVDMELADETPVAAAPFVTETMAELYVSQGHPERARDVYAQLLAANPSDDRLRGLVDSLAPAPQAPSAGTARDFFSRLASRRAGNRAAIVPPSADDFAPMDSSVASVDVAPPDEVPYSVAEAEEPAPEGAVGEEMPEIAEAPEMSEPATFAEMAPEPEPELEPEPEVIAEPEPVAPALERAAKMRTPNGSIDALFGNRVPGTSADSAASALAQAFGGVTEGPLPSLGRPAHTATGELSLDSVFRDGPPRTPRTSQSFSFDQFFTGSASGASDRSPGGPGRTSGELAAAGDEPAEKSPEDIEQFNSWLQGLKQR